MRLDVLADLLDRGLPLISKLPPAASQLWEASTMCTVHSAPLIALSWLCPLVSCASTMYKVHIISSLVPCTSYLSMYHVSQICSLAPGKAAQFLCLGPSDFSLMSLLSVSFCIINSSMQEI